MFELITAISFDLAKGTAAGTAIIPGDDPLLADHFPGFPLLPGTLAVELACQIAGPLAEESIRQKYNLERWAILGMIRQAKFPHPAMLPATLQLNADLLRLDKTSAILTISAFKKKLQILQGEIIMIMTEPSPDRAEPIQARQDRIARWKAV